MTSANTSPMASVDYTLGTLSPLGGSQWSSGAFDSVEMGGDSSPDLRDQNCEEPKPAPRQDSDNRSLPSRRQDSETRSLPSRRQSPIRPPSREGGISRLRTPEPRTMEPRTAGGVVLAPPQDSSVYSAIERMLVSSKTGIHPVQQVQQAQLIHQQRDQTHQQRDQIHQRDRGIKRHQSSESTSPQPEPDIMVSKTQQWNQSPGPERSKSPTSVSTVSVDGSEASDRTIIPAGQQNVISHKSMASKPNVTPQQSMASQQSMGSQQSMASQQSMTAQSTPTSSLRRHQSSSLKQRPSQAPPHRAPTPDQRNRSRKRTTSSGDHELKPPTGPEERNRGISRSTYPPPSKPGQPTIPPPKPKRTLRPGQPKQVNGGTKGSILAEAMQRGSLKQSQDSSRKVSFKEKTRSGSSSTKNSKILRNVSVQYEEMPPDFSDFMLDQEDSYFCKLDGLVRLMKERPTSQETQEILRKVKLTKLTFHRSKETQHIELHRIFGKISDNCTNKYK